eukprot:15936371-Heterocapsa_arctica.AAC.1
MALEFDPGKDPAITLRVEQFWEFAHVWGSKTRWMRVTGIMGAIVATLLDIGWEPIRPNYWLHPGEATAIILDDQLTKPKLAFAVQYLVSSRIWQKTSRHPSVAQGLANGADLTAAR